MTTCALQERPQFLCQAPVGNAKLVFILHHGFVLQEAALWGHSPFPLHFMIQKVESRGSCSKIKTIVVLFCFFVEKVIVKFIRKKVPF
jgi:hypothetical protein